MIGWEVIRRQVAIAGGVTEAITGRPLKGVRVEITAAPTAFEQERRLQQRQHGERWEGMPARLDRTHSAGDGHFHFLDLPDGAYTLTASLAAAGSRYGAATAAPAVARDGEGNLTPATADLILPATSLAGRVSGDGDAVAMAEIRVEGSGEQTFSNETGDYTLAALEAGERRLRVSKQGFRELTVTVSLAAGVAASLDPVLERT